MAQKEPGAAGSRLFFRAFRYPFLNLFTLAAAGLGAFAVCAFAASLGDFIEAAAMNRAVQTGAGCALRAALWAVVCAAACAAGNLAGGLLAARVERDSLIDYYNELAAKDVFFPLRRAGAEIVSGIREGASLGTAIAPGLLRLCQVFAACLACSVMAARIHFLLAPFPALFTLWLFFSLKGFDLKKRATALEENQRRQRLSADGEEAAAGRETFAAQVLVQDAVRKFDADAVFLRNAGLQREKTAAWYAPAFFVWIFLGISLGLACVLRQKALLSLGGFASFAGSLPVFLYAVHSAPSAYAALRRGEAAARSMLKILQEEPSKKTAAEPSKKNETRADGPSLAAGAVVFDNVFFSYGTALALRRVSFSLEPGSFTVITGSPGSGKTSLARLIAGIIPPDIGSVQRGGDSRAAFIEKEPFLFPLSVRENIAFGCPAVDEAALRAAAEKAEAHEFISRLPEGYNTRVGEGGARLRDDEALRITLARVFLTDPRVLVVDDAGKAADSETEDRLNKALDAAARGRTVCLVSHKPSRICRADYILFMKAGELLCQGSHEKLVLESADYRRIFSGL